MPSLEEMARRHNKRVENAFKRAEKGATIDLTKLMISKEKLLLRKRK